MVHIKKKKSLKLKKKKKLVSMRKIQRRRNVLSQLGHIKQVFLSPRHWPM